MRRLLIALALSTSSLLAQTAVAEKRPLTLDDVLLHPAQLLPRRLAGLAWHPDGKRVTYVDGDGDEQVLVAVGIEDGKKTALVGTAELEAAAKGAGLEGLSLRALAGGRWEKDGRVRAVHKGRLVHVTPGSLQIEGGLSIPADVQASAWSPDDSHAAYTKDFDVYVKKPDGSTFRVTRGGFESYTHGLSVSRVEFGIHDGLWWDGEGRRLAFYREDLRPIESYPYVDVSTRPARLAPGRYPMAGRKGSVVSVGVYDTRDDSVVWLATDPARDEYLTNVTWGPDGKTLYVAHVGRDQNRMELRTWDAATGKAVTTLFVEEDEQWVEPEHGPVFVPDGGGEFLWLSPRDGHQHYYLYAADGHLLQQVTRGPWDVTAHRGFDAEGDGFFFETSGPDPRHKHLYHATLAPPRYKVEFEGEKSVSLKRTDVTVTPVTKGRGRHDTIISPDGRHVLDRHSHLELPPVTEVIAMDGSAVRVVHECKNPLRRIRTGESRFFTTKSDDGEDLHGHLILPPDLDESKKHPVLLYVYAGPHSQFARDEWMGGLGRTNLWLHYMATQGFVCFRVDGHGTRNRGIEWVQAIHRRLGTLEIRDQLKGLEHVLGLGFTDAKRVGVTGWSYGGFMTLSLMTRAGKHFRAGVSGAPVTDWRFYETGYGERYMDRPEENEKGYDEADPGRHVDGLEGRLLVVHGTSDVTVVWQNTLDFIHKCIEAGKDVDYMVYPGQLHGLRGRAREHFYRKMTRFFLRELGAPEAAGTGSR